MGLDIGNDNDKEDAEFEEERVNKETNLNLWGVIPSGVRVCAFATFY